METWFTGDEHYGHALLEQMRGLSSRDHEELLISNHNAMVRKSDRVIHVGDFAYRMDDDRRLRRIFAALNGSHFIVLGNHDSKSTLALGWAGQPSHQMLLKVGDHRLYLAHYAHRTWPGIHRGVIHLYGHSHGRIPADDKSCDVGVDVWGMMPTNIEQIKARLALAPPHVDPESEDGPGNDDGGLKP